VSARQERAGEEGTAELHAARVRELVGFALERLPAMQLGDGTFRRPAPPGADPEADRRSTRQTAIVLLGLLRAEEYGIDHPFHTGGLRGRLLGEAGLGTLDAGDLGLLLWAETRLDGAAAAELIGGLATALGEDGPGATSGSELAWIVIALAETGARGLLGAAGEALAEEARAELLARRREDTGLFQGPGHGPGRRFQSFEAQIQIIAALIQLRRLTDDSEAGETAIGAAGALIDLQRDDGSWPAVLDARRGAAVEPYPLSSVNQVALAPIAMQGVSALAGDPRFSRAAERGMAWVWGENELAYEMLDHQAGTLCRAITRRERMDRAHLLARAATSFIKPVSEHEARHTLRVDRTTSPADLGWILEAWAGHESPLPGAASG